MTDTTHPANHAQLQDDAPRRGATPMLWILLALAVIALAWWLFAQRNTGIGTGTTTDVTATTPTETAVPAATPARSASGRARASANTRGNAGTTTASAGSRDAALLAHETPRYPVAAVRSGVEGTVMLRIAVDANGVPTDIGYAQRSGNQDLDRAAMQAARDWRFRPAQRDGRAVASTVNVPVHFVLPATAQG